MQLITDNSAFHTHNPPTDCANLPQPLDGGNNSGCHLSDRPVSIHFRETSQSPVVLDNGRGQCLVSAHALLAKTSSVSSARWTSAAPSISQNPSTLGGFDVDVVDGLADRTIPAPRNPAQ